MANKEYRVTGLAASYSEPRAVTTPDGKSGEILVQTYARRGEVVTLNESEANRLKELGVVKGVDEPLGYEEMNESQLADLAKERGVQVRGSGANGEPVEADYINALRNADAGGGIVVASDGPGGPVLTSPGQAEGVRLEGPRRRAK